MSALKRTAIIALIFIVLMVNNPSAEGQPGCTPRELSFTVYVDGYVMVSYSADIDPTRPRVNVSLPGSLFMDLLVEDLDGLPLDYSTIDGGLTIDTLGVISVLITYVTSDLTGKSRHIWSFNVSTAISSSILLPESAIIIYLNEVPLAMSSLDGSLLLTMPAGDLEISYTIGIVGNREHALALIQNAEKTIEAIKANDVVVDQADDLLEQAYTAFNEEQYPEAERLAGLVKSAAIDTEAEAALANEAINVAQAAITAASNAHRTVGLDQAESFLQQAENMYEVGNYTAAQALAEQSENAAIGAEAPRTLYTWLIAALAAVAISIASVLYIRKRTLTGKKSIKTVDLEALLEEHQNLRVDDREVVRFLAEVGGEAFAAKIRERFDIPRTSMWRMIRRLQREGLVESENVGGQTLVKLISRYREGEY